MVTGWYGIARVTLECVGPERPRGVAGSSRARVGDHSISPRAHEVAGFVTREPGFRKTPLGHRHPPTQRSGRRKWLAPDCLIPPPAPSAAVRTPGQLSEQPSSCRRRSIRTRSRLDTVPSSIPTRPLPGPLFAVVRQARGKPMNREEAESIISVRGAVLPPRCAAGSAPRDHRRSRPPWQVLMIFTERSIGSVTSRFIPQRFCVFIAVACFAPTFRLSTPQTSPRLPPPCPGRVVDHGRT